MNKDTTFFLVHILETIKDVEEFSRDLDRKELEKNKLKQQAIIRSIEVIGEAAKNVPLNLRHKYPSVPWKEIIGARDKMIHHYFGVDLDIVWDIIKNDLPTLRKQIQEIKDGL